VEYGLRVVSHTVSAAAAAGESDASAADYVSQCHRGVLLRQSDGA